MTYENIRLEKSLYTTGKSFTQALESLDPSENYIGTELENIKILGKAVAFQSRII